MRDWFRDDCYVDNMVHKRVKVQAKPWGSFFFGRRGDWEGEESSMRNRYVCLYSASMAF